MLFNSFVFCGVFLPLTLVAFWLAPNDRLRRGVLLAASLIYYAYWAPTYLPLLVILVAVAWYAALLITSTGRKWPVVISAIALFGALACFKYSGFIVTVATDLGAQRLAPAKPITLPLGISFIAFQAMGYVIDVARGQFKAEPRFTKVLLFKSFFPQLIAGPICRAHELMPQLDKPFQFRLAQFCAGLAIFSVGLLLKLVFADGLAPAVDKLFAVKEHYAFVSAWTAALGFGMQIYADFWGYSTMAVGLARMFDIHIPVNFTLPYVSQSLREFWRRWHITLSQWLRDYLYKPLGGSHHGKINTVVALITTMLLGGLWHGANYTFVLWGALHGVSLVVEHLLDRSPTTSRTPTAALFGWIWTTTVVFAAWVLFRSSSLAQALAMWSAMASPVAATAKEWSAASPTLTTVAILFLIQVPLEALLDGLRKETLPPAAAVAIGFWATILAIVLGAPVTVPFIYFQF